MNIFYTLGNFVRVITQASWPPSSESLDALGKTTDVYQGLSDSIFLSVALFFSLWLSSRINDQFNVHFSHIECLAEHIDSKWYHLEFRGKAKQEEAKETGVVRTPQKDMNGNEVYNSDSRK